MHLWAFFTLLLLLFLPFPDTHPLLYSVISTFSLGFPVYSLEVTEKMWDEMDA